MNAFAPRRETASLKLAKLRGMTFVNQYVVIKYLGKGANGRVFLCLDMCDTRLYAVKARPLTLTLSPFQTLMSHRARVSVPGRVRNAPVRGQGAPHAAPRVSGCCPLCSYCLEITTACLARARLGDAWRRASRCGDRAPLRRPHGAAANTLSGLHSSDQLETLMR